jgi:hypothetical protein
MNTLIALSAMALLLMTASSSCGSAAGLAAQLAQSGSLSDDGTPDQGRGDFGVVGSGGNSTDDDGTPDQGSGDFGIGGGGNSANDDGTPDQGRGDRGNDRDNDDDNSGRG